MARHRRGRKVVLIYADLQWTARDWRVASPEDADLPPAVALARPESLTSSLKLELMFGGRVVFAMSMTECLSVYDHQDGQAKAEIDLLVDELEAKAWL